MADSKKNNGPRLFTICLEISINMEEEGEKRGGFVVGLGIYHREKQYVVHKNVM